MGSPPDEWGHAVFAEDEVLVTLSRPFLIGQYEITQAQWTGVGFPNPSGLTSDGASGDCLAPDCPVGNVTWFEAAAFANALSSVHTPPLDACYALGNCNGEPGTGMVCDTADITAPTLYQCTGYRLPTHAEWEYAIRAGTRTAFYSGDITVYDTPGTPLPDANLERIAWYGYNAGPRTHPVGKKEPNAFGIYDMSGNALEWVNDRYSSKGYGTDPITDPGGIMSIATTSRLMLGGSFNVWSTLCRSSARRYASPSGNGHGLGFRLVRTLAP